MMKKLFFVLTMLVISSTALLSDCERFIEKYVKPLEIDGFVIKKEMKDNLYIIEIENNDKEKIILQLFKNRTSGELFNFIGKTTRIIKKKGSEYTRLIDMHPDRINVRHFEFLCEGGKN
jgi:hypothetical protein